MIKKHKKVVKFKEKEDKKVIYNEIKNETIKTKKGRAIKKPTRL